MANPGGTFRGCVQAVHAPDRIDADGLDYFTIGMIDVVPPAPEKPWVLSIDLSKSDAIEMCATVLRAIAGKARIVFVLESERKGRIAAVRLENDSS